MSETRYFLIGRCRFKLKKISSKGICLKIKRNVKRNIHFIIHKQSDYRSLKLF